MTDIVKEGDDTKGRYVSYIDGFEAELTFTRPAAGIIQAEHTGVPEQLGGRGLGRKLTEALAADARAQGWKVVPVCPFVRAQFDRTPQWQDLLAQPAGSGE